MALAYRSSAAMVEYVHVEIIRLKIGENVNYKRLVDMMRDESCDERKRCISSIILSKLLGDGEKLPENCAHHLFEMVNNDTPIYIGKNIIQALRHTNSPDVSLRILSGIWLKNKRFGPAVAESLAYINKNCSGVPEYAYSLAVLMMGDEDSLIKDESKLVDVIFDHSKNGDLDAHCDAAMYASMNTDSMPAAVRSLIALSHYSTLAEKKIRCIWENCKSIDAFRANDKQVRNFVAVFALTECNYNLNGLLMDILDYYLDTNYEPAREEQEDIVRTILNSLKSVKVLSLEDISAIHAVIEMSSNMAVWTAALEVVRVHSPSTIHLVDIDEKWKLGTMLEQYLLTEEGTELDIEKLFDILESSVNWGTQSRILSAIAHSGKRLDGFQVNRAIRLCRSRPFLSMACLVNTDSKDGIQYLCDRLLGDDQVSDMAIECLYKYVTRMGSESDAHDISKAMRLTISRSWFSSDKIKEISYLTMMDTYAADQVMNSFRASLFDISISPNRVGFISGMIAAHRPKWVRELITIIPERNRAPFINSLSYLSGLDDGVAQILIWLHSKGYGLPFLYHSMAEAHSVNGLSGGGIFDDVQGDGSQGNPISISGNKMIEVFLYSQLGKYEKMSEAEFMAVTTALQSVDVEYMLRFVNSHYEALTAEKKDAVISAVSYGLVLNALKLIVGNPDELGN